MAVKKGLGKGLDSLIPATPKGEVPAKKKSAAKVEPKSVGKEEKADMCAAESGADCSESVRAEKLIRGTIDIFLGLRYSAGDVEMYREFLRMFCDMSKEKTEKIQDCYEQENWEDYTVLVHALKSTSLSVGAGKLSESALELEKAGKEKQIDFIFENHDALLKLYEATVSEGYQIVESDICM